MAVTKSSLVDNIKSKGSTGAHTDSTAAKDRGAVNGNKLRVITGTLEVNTSDFDADGDVLVLCALHIDDVVHQIWIANDDLDSGTDSVYNLGLYSDAAGTQVEDEDYYATLSTGLQSARAFTDERFEAANIDDAGQSVWQDAGYASRAAALAATEAYNGYVFLAMTQTATVGGDQAGTVSFRVVLSSDH